MAKARPSPTLIEMQSKLGFKVDSFTYPDESLMRFYSDLRLVPQDIYGKTREEYEVFETEMYRKDEKIISKNVPPALDEVKTIEHKEDTVTLICRNHVVFYKFNVNVRHGYGFDLQLLLTSDEAFRILSVAKLQSNPICNAISILFRLPVEVRNKIYTFALPWGQWQTGDVDSWAGFNFTGSIGDPSGFYFPLSSELAILRVNRQMRWETLSIAYRRTIFRLDDIDDLIKLLIAVGRIGRDNIESLEFAWESRADSEFKWDDAPDSDNLSLTLPTLHAAKCVQLLRQCKRLKYLRLYFENDLITSISPNIFENDPGIRGLRSIRGIERVQIYDLGHEPIEQLDLAKWLKKGMESSWVEEQREERTGTRDHNQ